jgi:hypothetical protein
MNSLVERRARIARIRMIERRVAEFALARADRELKHVENIVERLGMLRDELGLADGETSGATLAATAEMKMRLASASQAAARPLLEASNRRQEQHAFTLSAHRKADGAQTLLEKSSANAAKADATRADANRIARRAMISGEDL